LLKFAPFADGPAVLDAVRDALTAVAVRDGKPEAVLVEALDNKLPVCRGLAADALVRVNQAGAVPAVRKLLDDSDRQVRLRVALAFVDRKDKSAVSRLIELLAELPREQSRPIEDVLERIALGKSPNVPAGDDEATRKKCRDAWNDWWTKNGDAVDLAKVPAKLVVAMETSLGTIKIELYQQKAPITVKNFLQYVEDKHYDGLIFHRVIENFMIQGGGFEPSMKEKKTRDAIKNEAANGLSNERGTIAMARTNVPDSATAQFYINVKDNPFLDKAKSRDQVGYCVFGRVIEGMDVVDKIKAVKTAAAGGFNDVPVEDVVIRWVRLVR
jgi:peptidyl-prolyl cis-trans isomerase B (cyclophilin B)